MRTVTTRRTEPTLLEPVLYMALELAEGRVIVRSCGSAVDGMKKAAYPSA